MVIFFCNMFITDIIYTLGIAVFASGFKKSYVMFFLLEFIVGEMAALGITAGAHRLWSHRSYKATRPLKLLLLTFYAIAGQVNV